MKKVVLLSLVVSLAAVGTNYAAFQIVNTTDKFNDIIKNKKDVVVKFYATWCAACKKMAPIFKQASDKHKNVTFIKVDTDKAEKKLTHNKEHDFAVHGIPTFIIFKDGKKVDEFTGVLKKKKFHKRINKHFKK